MKTNSMKPLETSQQVLTWLCGVPPREFDTKQQKISYIVFTSGIIIIHLMSVISSAVFIYRNVSVNLEETLFSLFHNVAAISSLYESILTVLLRRKLSTIFDDLSKINDENKDGDFSYLLKQTNEKCEWMWTIYIKYIIKGYLVSTVINAVVSVAVCFIQTGHFEVEQAHHPYKFVHPWNQSTLPGYSLEICFDVIAAENYLLANGSLLILFISMCLHHQTFYEMFRNEASKLNYRDEDRNDAEHLCKMIRFHISVKDWFVDSAGTYSSFILVQLICSMIFLACVVFQLDLEMKHPGFELVTILIGILGGGSNLFLYCYFGKKATESHEQMAECLYDCEWHELDLKHQKYILIMMMNTQRPIYYHGFGVAVLNLETFTDMIRAVFSYYMMFKTLTSK